MPWWHGDDFGVVTSLVSLPPPCLLSVLVTCGNAAQIETKCAVLTLYRANQYSLTTDGPINVNITLIVIVNNYSFCMDQMHVSCFSYIQKKCVTKHYKSKG